jgi:hypothetical protein
MRQGGAGGAAGPASAPGSAFGGGPPGARRATPGSAADQNALYGNADQCAWAVILGSECPARGPRVKTACGVATRSASLNPDAAPAPKGLAPARTTDQASMAEVERHLRAWRRPTVACAPVVAAASTGEQTFCEWYGRCGRSGLQVAEDRQYPAVVGV